MPTTEQAMTSAGMPLRIAVLGVPASGTSSLLNAMAMAFPTEANGRNQVAHHLYEGSSWKSDDVRDADAIVVTLDANTATDGCAKELGCFLGDFRSSRGEGGSVGGLPIFLVLTKCDGLTQPGDTETGWMERVEERKRCLARCFREFLEPTEKTGPVPFGSIDLHLWATAVKRPDFGGSPMQSAPPYGVAELFRQCLEQARGYHMRRERSNRRLKWLVSGTGTVLAGLLILATMLVVHRQFQKATALSARVDLLRFTEGTKPASERLREPLERKLTGLMAIRNDPEFDQLPAGDREFIEERLDELEDYIEFREKVLGIRLADVTTETALQSIETHLKKDLALPVRHEKDWEQTEAALLRSILLKDVQALRAEAREMEEWYWRLSGQGEELRTFSKGKPTGTSSWSAWLGQGEELIGKSVPFAESEPLPGATTVGYGTVLRFERVAAARKNWELLKPALRRLCDLIAALGLAGKLSSGEPQPLDIPAEFPIAQARDRVRLLEERFPRLSGELSAIELPDAVAEEIRRSARRSYEHLIDSARPIVLDRLRQGMADGQETWAAWRSLESWLADPEELREWRVLATLLAEVQDGQARDPVTVLAEFLRQDHFDLDWRLLTLQIPFERNLRPTGMLTVYHGAPPGKEIAPALVFKLADENGRRDSERRVTVYTFERQLGRAFVYHPGDHLHADLCVERAGVEGDWVLTWARSRSEVYQFERLTRPPRLHQKMEENTKGELAEDVVLSIIPPTGNPQVPDLVPVVKSRR
jgi:hypothetical protein